MDASCKKIENQPFPGQTTNLGSYKNKSGSDLKEERTLPLYSVIIRISGKKIRKKMKKFKTRIIK